MADVFTGLDVRVFISTTAVTSATDTTGEFAALTWTEIELVESLDPYGDTAGIVNFNALKDGRVRKGKGARNAGDPTLTVGYDYSDPGQAALRAAQGTASKYGFKVQLPNKLATAGADQIDYFRAMVMSDPKNVGNTETVVRQTFQLAIDSPIYTTAPTTGA
jgi:hypothetical protein